MRLPGGVRMSGLSGFRHNPGVRRLPRPGRAGGSPDLVSVPRLPGRRSGAGSGHGGTAARDGSGRGMGTSVPCRVTVRVLPGGMTPARSSTGLRAAARTFPAPPQGATCGVQPHSITGAPSRGASKATASSRQALLLRRASVVTSAQRTATRSERASDDAEARNRQSAESVDTQRREQGLWRA